MLRLTAIAAWLFLPALLVFVASTNAATLVWQVPSGVPLNPSVSDMAWDVAAPAGAYLFISGMIQSSEPNVEAGAAFVVRVRKFDGGADSVPPTLFVLPARMPGLINGARMSFSSDGTRVYLVGWQPWSDRRMTGFAAQMDASSLQPAGFGRIDYVVSGSESAFSSIAVWRDPRTNADIVYAGGFVSPLAFDRTNADWHVAAFDASGRTIASVTAFAVNSLRPTDPASSYYCDDEINDLIVDDDGVYLVGQVDGVCPLSAGFAPKPGYSVVLKFGHDLSFRYAWWIGGPEGQAAGWALKRIQTSEGKRLVIVSAVRHPDRGYFTWRVDLLRDTGRSLESVAHNYSERDAFAAVGSGFKMPRRLDVSADASTAMIVGVGIDVSDRDCASASTQFQECWNWQLERWEIGSASVRPIEQWAAFAGNERSDMAHGIAFDTDTPSRFYVVGCMNAPTTDPALGCWMSDPAQNDGFDLSYQAYELSPQSKGTR